MIQINAKHIFTTKTGQAYSASENFIPWTLSSEESHKVLNSSNPLEEYKAVISQRPGMIDEVPFFSNDPVEQEEMTLMFEAGFPDAVPQKFVKLDQAALHLQHLADYEHRMNRLGFEITVFPWTPEMNFEMKKRSVFAEL